MNIIIPRWDFKLQIYPDGLNKEFKDRFYARGEKQLKGIDFFETYAPVVKCTTIILILILEIIV